MLVEGVGGGVQLSMTTYLVGLAVGQLIIGPLSDTLGRRRPLLLGTFLAMLAAVAAALALAGGIIIPTLGWRAVF